MLGGRVLLLAALDFGPDVLIGLRQPLLTQILMDLFLRVCILVIGAVKVIDVVLVALVTSARDGPEDSRDQTRAGVDPVVPFDVLNAGHWDR